MMLLVDIGNTRIKWATSQNGQFFSAKPVVHYGQALSLLWGTLWAGLPPPQRVLVASVAAPDLATSLAAWVQAQWAVPAEFIRSTAQACGVGNGYRHPDMLGVDRWLALIGARQLQGFHGRPLCVVDCGTALTVDALTVDGHHLGGWIAPGLVLMRRQLGEGTAALSGVPSPQLVVSAGFGHTTAEALMMGITQAAAGLVARALREAQEVCGQEPLAVVTGGDGPTIMPLLPADALFVPDLVLQGLAAVAVQPGEQ